MNSQPLKKVSKASDLKLQIKIEQGVPQTINKIISEKKNNRASQEHVSNSKVYFSSKDFSKLGSSYFGESEGSF